MPKPTAEGGCATRALAGRSVLPLADILEEFAKLDFGSLGDFVDARQGEVSLSPLHLTDLLIRAPIHQCALLEPRHHAAQAGADRLNRVLLALGLELLEVWLARFALCHPLVGK
jgi:hypothetical protein